MSPSTSKYVLFGAIFILSPLAKCEGLPDGYVIQGELDFEIGKLNEATREENLQCPSSNVIKTRYRCKVSSHWTDCHRKSCCPGYTLVLGQCIPETVDPCDVMNLCEQKCSVYLGRVICTCFAGYKFNATKHR